VTWREGSVFLLSRVLGKETFGKTSREITKVGREKEYVCGHPASSIEEGLRSGDWLSGKKVNRSSGVHRELKAGKVGPEVSRASPEVGGR